MKLDSDTLKKRLRYQGKQYSNGQQARGGVKESHMLEQAADYIEELESSLRDLLNDCINFDGGKLTDCILEKASNILRSKVGKINNEQGYTDGGQNPHYEGLFDGETDDDKEKRIRWAMNEDQLPWPGMMSAFERYYGQSWFDKSYREETGIWAAAWKASKNHKDNS